MTFNIIHCGLCGKWPLLNPKNVRFINNLCLDSHPLLEINLCNKCYDKGMADLKWLRSEVEKCYGPMKNLDRMKGERKMSQFYYRTVGEEPQKGDTAVINTRCFSPEENCYTDYFLNVELLGKLEVTDSDDIFWLVKGYEENDKIQIVAQEDLIDVGYFGD